jgi:hypothetical protein
MAVLMRASAGALPALTPSAARFAAAISSITIFFELTATSAAHFMPVFAPDVIEISIFSAFVYLIRYRPFSH